MVHAPNFRALVFLAGAEMGVTDESRHRHMPVTNALGSRLVHSPPYYSKAAVARARPLYLSSTVTPPVCLYAVDDLSLALQ